MRILTRAAGSVFIAAALATAMAPAAGAATTTPAQAQWGGGGGDDHGCHTSYYRHHISHRCWNVWNEYYPDHGFRDHDGIGDHDGDHHDGGFDSNKP